MILTLKELADHLRVNERTIMRMLKSGQINGTKIGGQWRFNSSQIHSLFFPDEGESLEETPLGTARTHYGITISRVLQQERMVLDLKGTDAESVLRELASPARFNALLLDVNDLQERLLSRESLLSTGVGSGVAVPHPRDPIPTLRAPAVAAFGRSKAGVDFGAIDGKPVHLLFMLCCQNIEMHLHLMGRLARLLRNDQFVDGCLNGKTPEDITRLLLEHERAHFLHENA
ncbi:MAG: PTS transporter subunit EIIA [Lentisphaerae bacterium]|nr:PTS transporter subunit EIIA [Lentisphaerota bacterium]MBT4822072.1 PTS transporter subunit EIIA [Lentisphaerota bacterium]MBT5610659.1 PTS transporter subunit EIIA [Lentisphaerota bacterium]MBT7059458.1 PTS transporter subunit EIIA [Lentisphaerota bacterium]MBT7847842.1 PTS transporter subunit EIIA [Lentisphaerota bacterium]